MATNRREREHWRQPISVTLQPHVIDTGMEEAEKQNKSLSRLINDVLVEYFQARKDSERNAPAATQTQR